MEVAQGANWTGSRLQASWAASVGAPFLICSPNNANAEHVFSWWPVIPHCNEAASPPKVVALRQAVARLLAHSAPHKARDNWQVCRLIRKLYLLDCFVNCISCLYFCSIVCPGFPAHACTSPLPSPHVWFLSPSLIRLILGRDASIMHAVVVLLASLPYSSVSVRLHVCVYTRPSYWWAFSDIFESQPECNCEKNMLSVRLWDSYVCPDHYIKINERIT